MKDTNKLKKLGTALILASFLFSLFTALPISQPARAYTPEEQLDAAKAKYPTILNGGFETGDFTGWTYAGTAHVIKTTDAPDGTYVAKFTSNAALHAGRLLMGKTLSFYYKGINTVAGYEVSFYPYAYCYDKYNNFLSKINILGTGVYDTKCPNWRELVINLTEVMPSSTAYFELHFGGAYGCTTGLFGYFDKIAVGEFTEPNEAFSINGADVNTVQSQYEFCSFWLNNQYGVTVNNVKLTVQNFALKSLTVDCVGISGNDIGYMEPSQQKFIQLGIESPSALGYYNVSVLLIGYDIYGYEILRETFLLQVYNELIKVTITFNRDTYELGQFEELSILNEMDRQISFTVSIWYGANLIEYEILPITLATGCSHNFTMNLIEYGKYTFEFKINFEEILQQRTLVVRKSITVIPTNDIECEYATELYEMKGNQTFDYALFTNNTEVSNYTFYARVTYLNGGQYVYTRSADPGLYKHYFPIPLPANYSQGSFKIEIFRQLTATADIQYGTGEYYSDGIKVWQKTYTVYEGKSPVTPLGWPELENYQWILIALAIVLASFGFMYLAIRRRKR